MPGNYDFSTVAVSFRDICHKQEEQNSTLIAEVGDEITLYPHRMSEEHQEFFAIDLGEDVWQELMEQASGDEGVQLDLE